jgi:Na+-driven multidrug efflux pump
MPMGSFLQTAYRLTMATSILVSQNFGAKRMDELRRVVQTLRIGLPSAVQQSFISIGMVLVTGIINGFGEEATAAFGAGSRIDQIAFMPRFMRRTAPDQTEPRRLRAAYRRA